MISGTAIGFAVILAVVFGVVGQNQANKGLTGPLLRPTGGESVTSKSNMGEVSTSTPSNTESELIKAKEMLDKGLIDEEEFKALKKKIIDRS